MSNESKDSQNQIILAVVSPPLILFLLNLLHPFLNYVDVFNNRSIHMDFENQHYLGIWIWLFLIPYAVLFFNRENKDIYLPTKLAVCVSAAMALLNPITDVYDWAYFFLVILWAGGAMYGLYWKASEKKKVDFGDYPLSVDPKGRYGFPTSSLHENLQIVGGTGTGKTHYVIKPFIEQTINQGLGSFILDVKGNMDKDVAFYADVARRRYFHFDLADPTMSHTFNPLYGDDPSAISNRVFAALYYDTNNSEPYYRLLAEAFLRNLIGLLKMEIKTLTFQDLLLATQEADTFKTINWFCAKYSYTPYAKYFTDQWLSKSSKERRMELSGLVNKLQRFCNSEWAFLLNVREPDIQMEKVVSYGEILLFSPDSARYPEDAKAISILAMMALSEQLAARYRTNTVKPFRIFLDEFYNLAYPRFIDFINKCREARMNIIMAHQSNGDLKGVSMEFFEQVMNTASNKIILRVNDPDTAEHFARQFGTELDLNYKVESFASNGQMAGYSKPQVEKFRFHPNLIKELKVGHAIIKIVGDGGVHIFETPLRMATKAPQDFNPRENLQHFNPRKQVNESSLPELIQEVGSGPQKGVKKGETPLEYQNAL